MGKRRERDNKHNKYNKYTACKKVMSIMGENKETGWAESRMLVGKEV